MKKILTSILTIAIMISMVLPSQGFALENKELETAINTAKVLFNIGDSYDDFNYGISKRNSLTVFNLTWRDTKNKLGNVDVTIDTTGRVLNYNFYNAYDNSLGRSKLPAVSKADALKTSNAFLEKVNPGAYSKIRYQENSQIVNIGDTNYNFSYTRVENNIPLYNNNINVSVNNRTGKVQSYYCEWTDELTFPDANGILTMDKAKQAYIDKLGLKLMYKLTYDNNNISKPYLIYGQTYTNRSIDAKTGGIINVSPYYGIMNAKGAGGMGAQFSTADSKTNLSPEERKAVEIASNLIDEKKAEEIARKILNIDSSYRLESINLYTNWTNKGDHTWVMYFVRENKDKTNEYFSAGASIDAATGEVINFNKSVPYDPKAAAKYNKDQCINIAKEIIKSLQPAKANEIEFTEWDSNDIKPLKDAELPKNYYFTFTRNTNGIYFPGNGFNISVDAVQGVVTNYNSNWYKGELPPSDKVISSQKAHEALFSNIGLELQYIADYSNNDNSKILPPGTTAKPDIKLVYSIKPGKPVNIDAFTGNVLDYSGKPYNEVSVKEYTDIAGCLGENEIKILAQYGIALQGTEFKPNNNITQRDFLYLLAKSVNPYMEYDIDVNSDESLYNYLVNSKIVNQDEKAPTATVTRQDAAKFIIRSLKYDHIADIKGIYTLTFTDKDNVNQNLYGYVALAYGLNIIKADDNLIKPVDYLSRAGAAVMIYNLLNIE